MKTFHQFAKSATHDIVSTCTCLDTCKCVVIRPFYRASCRGAPPGWRGASGHRTCGTRCFKSAACADTPRARPGSRLAQRRRRRCAQHVVVRELSRRLSRSAAHADGAVRSGSTNVCPASRDTRGGPRACCSRATPRRRACQLELALFRVRGRASSFGWSRSGATARAAEGASCGGQVDVDHRCV